MHVKRSPSKLETNTTTPEVRGKKQGGLQSSSSDGLWCVEVERDSEEPPKEQSSSCPPSWVTWDINYHWCAHTAELISESVKTKYNFASAKTISSWLKPKETWSPA